jgi:hypothetical protein
MDLFWYLGLTSGMPFLLGVDRVALVLEIGRAPYSNAHRLLLLLTLESSASIIYARQKTPIPAPTRQGHPR